MGAGKCRETTEILCNHCKLEFLAAAGLTREVGAASAVHTDVAYASFFFEGCGLRILTWHERADQWNADEDLTESTFLGD